MKRILTIAQLVWLEVVRRKDVYVLLILLLAFLIALLSINVFGLGNLVATVKDLGLLLVWVFGWVLSVGVSARQLPQEETRGTIFPLLAKPVSRAELVVGKWLGAWSVVSVCTLVFYGLLALIVEARGSGFTALLLAEGIALHIALLAVLTAVGVCFSTRLNYDAAATLTTVTTVAATLLLPSIPRLILAEAAGRKYGLLLLYYALPHLELFDMRRRMIHGWEPAAMSTVLTVLAYGAALTVAILLIAWLAYRNKRFSRGTLL